MSFILRRLMMRWTFSLSVSYSVYFLASGTCASVTNTGYLQVPVAVFLLILRYMCLGKCFFISSDSCAWGNVSCYLQVPVPGEMFLLIFRYLCLGKWFCFLLIFRYLCLGKCFFLSWGSSVGVSDTGYLQMGNKQTNKTPREPHRYMGSQWSSLFIREQGE